MMISFRKISFLFLLFIIFSFASSSKAASETEFLDTKVDKIVLDNGLTCLFVKRKGTPIFSAYLRVKVGNIEESPGSSGLAHFFEHMAFKGTPTIGTNVKNEFVTIYTKNGGADINATTGNDYTSYFVSLPSSKLELWAYMETERLLHPVLREFYTERDVVAEERRMRYDNDPEGRLYEAFLREAFSASPYGIPVIGKASDIQNYNDEEAKKFYETYYTPSRMVLALVGNFDLNEAKRLVKDYFGKIPQKPEEMKVLNIREPLVGFPREAHITGLDQPRFYMGFYREAYPNPDDEVFDVVKNLMCTGRTSRLYNVLVTQRKMVSEINCDTSVPGSRLDSYFTFYAKPLHPYTNQQVEKVILEEIEKMKQQKMSLKMLKKVKNTIEADLTWTLKTNMGLAHMITFFESLTGDWAYMNRLPEKIAQITPEDVQRVMRSYFVPQRRVVVSLEKKLH